MGKLNVFIPLTKVDEARREVWGTLAAEEPDASGEILDYARSKPRFEAWSKQIEKTSGGKSLGNVRAMHGRVAAGRLIAINFDDGGKAITGGAHVVDDQEWEKVLAGVYTGFSVGGSYGERWPDGVRKSLTRYEAIPVEVSLVDAPCIASATFTVIKADGSTELRKFAEPADDGVAEDGAEDAQEQPADEAVTESLDELLGKMNAQAAELDQRLAELEARNGGAEDAPAEDAAAGELEKLDPATELAAENMLDMAEDGEDGGKTVEVSLTTLAVMHEQVVALGAKCPMRYPARYRDEWGEVDTLADSPMEYVLSQLHDTLVALGAECVEPDEVTKAALAELSKGSGLDENEELAKAGRRISSSNMMHVQGIHDAAAKLGASCGDMGKSVMAGAVETGIIEGLRGQLESLKASLAKAASERSAFEATVRGLTERIAKLEDQPLPGGPVLSTEGLLGKSAEEIRGLVVEKRLVADSATETQPSAASDIDREIKSYQELLMKAVDPIAKQEIAAKLGELRLKKAQMAG